MDKQSLSGYLKAIGPGLLWAGAAIGVSHVVQSTTAGAHYRYALVAIILITAILKYPFFEFAPRYTIAKGESLLDGYCKIGPLAVGIFLVLTFGTMFTVQAAVTIVTASLAPYVFGVTLNPVLWSIILLSSCLLILLIGKYSLLDKLIKGILILLALSTLVATIAALIYAYHQVPSVNPSLGDFNESDVFFIVALLGWMPCPLDIAVWHSMWCVSRQKQTGYKPSMTQALFDYKLGYWGTILLALCFVILGAAIMFPTGIRFSDSGSVFAGQLIELYTKTLGDWSSPFIIIALFTTMFSTTLTCLDAFPRVLRRATEIFAHRQSANFHKMAYWFWIVLVSIGALFLIGYFMDEMRPLVTLATTLSFLTAPIFAYLNYRLVTSKHMPEEAKPGLGLRMLSWVGMIFLTGSCFAYLGLWLF